MKRKRLSTEELIAKLSYHYNQNVHGSDDAIIRVLFAEFAKRLGIKLC